MTRTIVIGAGIAGLAFAHFSRSPGILVLEQGSAPFGLAGTDLVDGILWDNGPHVSFTKRELVKRLFANHVKDLYREFEVVIGNYYHGNWIAHPAQCNLYQVPEPLRAECLESFLESRKHESRAPANYADWLEQAFGKRFAHEFPVIYTTKYWTIPPEQLTTEWVGTRVFKPEVQDVLQGASGPLSKKTHYINSVRYPLFGGYQSYLQSFLPGIEIQYNSRVVSIDLQKKYVVTADGRLHHYDRLVSTIPIADLVTSAAQSTSEVREASSRLSASQLLLINVAVPHVQKRPEHWIYVYDREKLSTRISFMEKMAPGNVPEGWSGIQVEVYFSKYRPMKIGPDAIQTKVLQELREMGLIRDGEFAAGKALKCHTKWISHANVIFDRYREESLEAILGWLHRYGLEREPDDLKPTTDWQSDSVAPGGDVVLAGRFGQWKYFWSDDCVMRGMQVAKGVKAKTVQ